MIRKRHRCPKCGKKTGVEIIYGYPTPQLFRQAKRKKVALGGCIVRGDDPDLQCTGCGHEWRRSPTSDPHHC